MADPEIFGGMLSLKLIWFYCYPIYLIPSQKSKSIQNGNLGPKSNIDLCFPILINLL